MDYVCEFIESSFAFNMWMIGAQKRIIGSGSINATKTEKVKRALSKLSKPAKKKITLYRGTVSMYPGMLNIDVTKPRLVKKADKKFLNDFKQNKTFIFQSALSTSTNRLVGEYYRKGSHGKIRGTFLHVIHVSKGVNVLDLKPIYKKCYPKIPKGPLIEYKGVDIHESEVILPPGTTLYPVVRRGNIFYWLATV